MCERSITLLLSDDTVDNDDARRRVIVAYKQDFFYSTQLTSGSSIFVVTEVNELNRPSE